MTRTSRLAGVAALAALLLIAAPVAAGGWATVTLTDPPDGPVAGEETTIGVDVKQHGATPISWDRLLFLGTHAASGETLLAEGRPEGPTGHYVISVTFPSEGRWEWTVRTVALQMEVTEYPAIAVGPAPAGAATQPVTTAAAQAATSAGSSKAGVDPLLVVGITVLAFFGGGLGGAMLRRPARGIESTPIDARSPAPSR